MKLAEGSRIKGLNLSMKLGEIVSLNHGEVLFQVVETTPGRYRLVVKADPTKYRVSRAVKAGVAKKEMGQ